MEAFFSLLNPIWVLCFSFFSYLSDARNQPLFSPVSSPVYPPETSTILPSIPFFPISPSMPPFSSGMPITVTEQHHLNIGVLLVIILVPIVVGSLVLSSICVWIYWRDRTRKSDLKTARSSDEWWMNFGIDDLELQNLAIRILSQTCSFSGCERNWSVFERIHTKRRNKLEHKRLNDLVYTHYNLRLKESVIVEALKVDSLQKLCSSLEPLLRRVVSEEVDRALVKLGHAKLGARSSPQQIECPQGSKLQLHFKSRLPPHLFTGGKVEGEQGAAIHVVLLDSNTGHVFQSGPESSLKLDIVVLEGDFNDESDVDWTQEQFESYEVKEREGKRPLLTGDLQVTLKEGVGTLGDLTFTDNSSWIRSRKFRLGVKVSAGFCDGVRVREAKTEAFTVKDHRGELYKKHYPPALHDEVWRLDRIAKDGALHKKLIVAKVLTVEDFLRLLVMDQQQLRQILGSGMSNKMWESTVDHAKTCVLSEKLYVYYTDETRSVGAVFNHIYELRGLITNSQYLSAESLSHSQKVSVDSLVKKAYDNWTNVIEYDGKALLSSMNTKKTQAPPPTSDYTPPMNHYHAPFTRTHHHLMSEPQTHFQMDSIRYLDSNDAPSGFPSERSEATVGLALAPPAHTVHRNVDYRPAGTPQLFGGDLSADWSRHQDSSGYDEFINEDEIRQRSSEMLENDDMQHLLRTFSVGVGTFNNPEEVSQPYNYEAPTNFRFQEQRSRSSGKAVVGWLKLKAALRWGIFIRKRAAERRAQIVELE